VLLVKFAHGLGTGRRLRGQLDADERRSTREPLVIEEAHLDELLRLYETFEPSNNRACATRPRQLLVADVEQPATPHGD